MLPRVSVCCVYGVCVCVCVCPVSLSQEEVFLVPVIWPWELSAETNGMALFFVALKKEGLLRMEVMSVVLEGMCAKRIHLLLMSKSDQIVQQWSYTNGKQERRCFYVWVCDVCIVFVCVPSHLRKRLPLTRMWRRTGGRCFRVGVCVVCMMCVCVCTQSHFRRSMSFISLLSNRGNCQMKQMVWRFSLLPWRKTDC